MDKELRGASLMIASSLFGLSVIVIAIIMLILK